MTNFRFPVSLSSPLGSTTLCPSLPLASPWMELTVATSSAKFIDEEASLKEGVFLPPVTLLNGKVRPRRKVAVLTPNDAWRERLKHIEGFLDVEAMLLLRQTCRLCYTHQYKPGNGILLFDGFRGYDAKILCDKVLPLACRALHVSTREEGLTLNFTGCTLLKDTSLARIMDAIHGDMKTNAVSGKVKAIHLDFCYQITDQGLAAMLSTHLPYLERLTLRCARNKQLTGLPFTTEISTERWPRFCSFACSFSNMWLESVTAVAHYITGSPMPASKGAPFFVPAILPSRDTCSLSPSIEIFGSWASRCFFEKLALGSMLKTFSQSVKCQNDALVSNLTKKAQKEFWDLANSEEWKSDALLQLVKRSGSEMLVNTPLTVETSEDGDVNVWTLPLSIAIQKMDHNVFNLLLMRGAKVDVWDYLGKSPLFRACEGECYDFAKILIGLGASTMPHDLGGLSALDIAIKKKDSRMVELLLKKGSVLNYRCPSLPKFKSALYVACEVNADEIIEMFLSRGADPNWSSPAKFTPALLAYQLNPAWLERFLAAGAGAPKSKRWVTTELLCCAIAKGDLKSIQLLVEKFPDLLGRPHLMWSLPHIQAVKLGKLDVLDYFLNAGSDINAAGSDGMTALLVATEEGNVRCVQLLLCKGADIDKPKLNGQTPIHTACLENRVKVAEVLLVAGCNVNTVDKVYEETSLMSCIRTRNDALSLLSLSKAAALDCDTVDGRGRTALMYAILYGQYEVADLLMTKEADVTVIDHFGISILTLVNERMSTQKAEKRVLRRFSRLYKTKSCNSFRPNSAATPIASVASRVTSTMLVKGMPPAVPINPVTPSTMKQQMLKPLNMPTIVSVEGGESHRSETRGFMYNSSETSTKLSNVSTDVLTTSKKEPSVTSLYSLSSSSESAAILTNDILPLKYWENPVKHELNGGDSLEGELPGNGAAEKRTSSSSSNECIHSDPHCDTPPNALCIRQSCSSNTEKNPAGFTKTKYEKKFRTEGKSVMSMVRFPISILRATTAK
ncbi:ankyrin repeat-containing protein [Cardiosporidium cionae]|uniref:Ankyrin repeat-containing protein n=1 Tax=Cardiosporidium cionae TaxID=476202 RepID=A0ABQ7JFP8_9APIC|nr:ankyrin repeat-containing protein [Cardiosporidium cionae]|eukprot:KAF8822705.1 ankyrin repeat-containing protein [Cardiosporidium cionae]